MELIWYRPFGFKIVRGVVMRIDYDLLREILQQVAGCEDVHGLNASDMKRHGYDG